MVFVVWFGSKVSVSDVGVKSASATAVPLTVEYVTVTTWLLAGTSVTVKTASPPSATGSASPMLSPGIGSAVIVPSPVESASVVPAGVLSSTVNVSLDSCVISTSTGTRMVFVVWLEVKISVPAVVV